MNRKLIRPGGLRERDHRQEALTTKQLRRRSLPPDETQAETNYYLKQMAARTPLVVVLADGEEIRGVLEWYDKDALKVHRQGAPNVLLMKHAVKYIYKEEDERGRGGDRTDE
jgi:sRNA-binding regulator protein Hfq